METLDQTVGALWRNRLGEELSALGLGGGEN